MLDLTPGERLRIERRRGGWTQPEAAQYYGMPHGAYKLAERDEPQAWDIPPIILRGIVDHEYCTVLRKREGLTQQQLADRIGVSKWWVCLMERGDAPVDTLLRYWTC